MVGGLYVPSCMPSCVLYVEQGPWGSSEQLPSGPLGHRPLVSAKMVTAAFKQSTAKGKCDVIHHPWRMERLCRGAKSDMFHQDAGFLNDFLY